MIYVLSDIHGCQDRFDSILDQIDLRPEDTLYILGDVIDRNPDGIRILRRIMAMPNAKMLLGNHELMMLQSIYSPSADSSIPNPRGAAHSCRLWYNNGGRVTHNYLKHIRKALREEIFEYLAGLPVNVKLEVNGRKFILTHAAPTELYPRYGRKYLSEKEFAVWYRYRDFEQMPEGYTVIHGHTPTFYDQICDPMQICYDKNRICIDCGCAHTAPEAWGGVHSCLACLRLDDMKVFYSEIEDNVYQIEEEMEVQDHDFA